MVDEDGNGVVVSKATIYVALFADESGTQRISDIKSMEFVNSYLEEVEFKDLKVNTTYYVIEVDQKGNPIYSMQIDGRIFNAPGAFKAIISDPDTYEVPLTNIALRQKEDGSITVTKKLETLSGEGYYSKDATFYVALFADEALTQRVSEVKPIHFVNSASETVTFTDLPLGKYYVSETEVYGAPKKNGSLSNGGVYGAVYPDGNLAEVTRENLNPSISFENVFSDIPKDY